MIEIDWRRLEALTGEALRLEMFQAIQTVAQGVQEEDEDNPRILGAVPRLAALIREKEDLKSFKPVLSTLARAVGLWNYIDVSDADEKDRLLAETAAVSIGKPLVLHREQIEALNILLAGRNLILSAPTSFGKSLLIDVLLATGRYNKVAIILPTIALLDEFRKRLTIRFGSQFRILMHHSQSASEYNKVIYLGTQERLVNRVDIGAVDLLVVDEFYKLDPKRQDDRSMTLNAAVYRLIRRARQFFFLGPNIEGLKFESDGRWRFEFLKTKFSTVAVDTFDLRRRHNKFDALKEEMFRSENWPALVFVSGPDAATTLARKLVETKALPPSKTQKLADWISENYSDAWPLVDAVRSGIGLHHGRIPRSISSAFVRMFNNEDESMPILLCTSTLIEGVNTAAKSVLIYDKVIKKSDYDFFTFSNIRGRAGRLGEHLVGKVFLFHSPPEMSDVEIGSPVFGDLDQAPDELVVHLEEGEQSEFTKTRTDDLVKSLGLSIQDLRRLSSLGIETLFEIKEVVNKYIRVSSGNLVWSGYPEYRHLLTLAKIVCEVRSPDEFGAVSAAQLEHFIRRLRAHIKFKNFFKDYAESNKGYKSKFENIFKFLRACEYSLPEYFTAIEKFVKIALPRAAGNVDYSLLASGLSNWFRPETLKALEEQGVPIQISERYIRPSDTIEVLAERLRNVASSGDKGLTDIEREWVLLSLPIPNPLAVRSKFT